MTRALSIVLTVEVTDIDDMVQAIKDLKTLLADSPWSHGIGLITIASPDQEP